MKKMAFSEYILKQRQNIKKECKERAIPLSKWIEENIEQVYEEYIRQPYLTLDIFDGDGIGVKGIQKRKGV